MDQLLKMFGLVPLGCGDRSETRLAITYENADQRQISPADPMAVAAIRYSAQSARD